MLQVTVPDIELFDDANEEFIYVKGQTLQLEHSLVSLRKWESKWCKPFLSKVDKTDEELRDYIRCMTLTQNVNPDIYKYLTDDIVRKIYAYIEAPMTATTINEEKSSKRNNRVVTAELIYYWMISLNIPSEYQKWHLNSLLTLIRVCNIENTPPKKRSKKDIMSRNAALNAARRQQLNSKG